MEAHGGVPNFIPVSEWGAGYGYPAGFAAEYTCSFIRFMW